MAGLFDLVDAEDLCGKLRRDYQRLAADPANVDAAFDFVVTAWHLLEWMYPGDGNRDRREYLRSEHPILQVCEHLAVGAFPVLCW